MKGIRGSTEFEKQFIDVFEQLCRRHHSWKVWQDFVNMSACAIANAVDKRPEVWKLREDSYMETIKRYSKDELNLISDLLGITTLALEENPAQDFLGKFYMRLDFGSGWHVAELMAKLQLGDEAKGQIASKDYISVCDSCCGAGCMLMAFANVCKDDMDINYQRSVLFVGQDIDEVVAKMCYIQISLLGCPGYVVVGNSLSEPICGTTIEPSYKKPENIWFTPLYFTDVWTLRRIRSWSENSHEKESKLVQMLKAEEVRKPDMVLHKPPQMPVMKKSEGKKPFSWKEFFTVKGKGKR
ncbi:SAM-dependent DNA methyltransferase [Lachnospiraceae bacterium]|nr:SAM-dependent DNA methyltransferase [Lachnospiraceae bacterium]